MFSDPDSPWADDGAETNQDWDKMASEFTNSGYREGITAGKESALQAGFDSGFAQVGVPIGQHLGFLRGCASGLLSFIASSGSAASDADREGIMAEIREINARLGDIHLSDMAPRDLEAEEHARQHLEDENDMYADDQTLADKRNLETLEDMLASLNPTGTSAAQCRPTVADLQNLEARLKVVCAQVGIPIIFPFN